MRGAAASVDPVTATLPVEPGKVHSGVPPSAGAADGHVLSAVGVSGTENGSAVSEVADELLVVDVSLSEPHAASIRRSGAADATTATEDLRGKFTVATVQARLTSMPNRVIQLNSRRLGER